MRQQNPRPNTYKDFPSSFLYSAMQFSHKKNTLESKVYAEDKATVGMILI